MRKLLLVCIVAPTIILAGCGPSKKERDEAKAIAAVNAYQESMRASSARFLNPQKDEASK